jgi:hypothetical protein
MKWSFFIHALPPIGQYKHGGDCMKKTLLLLSICIMTLITPSVSAKHSGHYTKEELMQNLIVHQFYPHLVQAIDDYYKEQGEIRGSEVKLNYNSFTIENVKRNEEGYYITFTTPSIGVIAYEPPYTTPVKVSKPPMVESITILYNDNNNQIEIVAVKPRETDLK